MARLLVFARGAVVVSTHAVAVGGTEPAGDPFAFDGGTELGNEFCVGCGRSSAWSSCFGDD